ncbi:MAG: aminotransferase class I/II-fold pyridoxal phosphate-dependent enzyme, partial [Spirochaetaceae bacterium]|nr:aminotransferase class I/II-fold pyridoxal phosphate-dependent enzyme [Spirochaetaceae bacterium]
MNSIAKELNSILEDTVVFDLLSDFGKRFYFPKGIVAQSAEAKQKAHKFNATVGMATTGGVPMYLESVKSQVPGLSPGEMFPYAPTSGVLELRGEWRSEMDKKNPSLKGKKTSLPLVTSGLTHGISTISDMFLNKGDSIVVPDMFWGNYTLIFEGRNEAEIKRFTFFNKEGRINIESLKSTIENISGDKFAVILNFPNNPTGYSPSINESEALIKLLEDFADKGKKILVITDDAYFGLFYEEETLKESLFGRFADLHNNILAVKVDGATKENFAWGFRLGFLTYASKGLRKEHLDALTKKTMGAIRASISNSSKMAQTLVLKSLPSNNYWKEKEEGFSILKKRYEKVREIISSFGKNSPLQALPFNSGYFMTFDYKGNSEKLRIHLLDKYGVGAISIQEKYLRIAYSSVELNDIE